MNFSEDTTITPNLIWPNSNYVFTYFAGKGPSPSSTSQQPPPSPPPTTSIAAETSPAPEDITPPPGPWGEKVLVENAAVHVDMGKVVGVLRATHKLEDEVNHQENGKNDLALQKIVI